MQRSKGQAAAERRRHLRAHRVAHLLQQRRHTRGKGEVYGAEVMGEELGVAEWGGQHTAVGKQEKAAGQCKAGDQPSRQQMPVLKPPQPQTITPLPSPLPSQQPQT